MSENFAIQLHHITKSFPGVKALDDVSFDVRYGTVHSIVGENGAGKSTLMKIIKDIHRMRRVFQTSQNRQTRTT